MEWRRWRLYQTAIHAKIAGRAAAREGQVRVSAISALRVARQLSAIALSKHAPDRLIEQITPWVTSVAW